VCLREESEQHVVHAGTGNGLHSNYLAFGSYVATPWETNPYLAFAEDLAPGVTFDDPSIAYI